MKLFSSLLALAFAGTASHAAGLDMVSLPPTHPLVELGSDLDSEWADGNISDGGRTSLEVFRFKGRMTNKALVELAGNNFRHNAHQLVTDEEVLEGKTELGSYNNETIFAISMALGVANAYGTEDSENFKEFEAPLQHLVEAAGITAQNGRVARTGTVFTTLEDGEDGAKNSTYDVIQYLVFNGETREGFSVFAVEGQMGEGPGHQHAGLCSKLLAP